MTNIAGEHLVVPRATIVALANHTLASRSDLYDDLKAAHFLIDDDSNVALDLLATKVRTRYSRLTELTGLFLFVVTLRCEHSCGYCQVSRAPSSKSSFDMRPEYATRGLEVVFQAPSPSVKIEIQGGEPLLNFPLVAAIIKEAVERNVTAKKDLAFVVASNLALLTDEHLEFFSKYNVFLSTSLDGPRSLHNKNRPRPGADSWEKAVAGIERARAVLGHDRISALMTTTPSSIEQPEQIVDEYVRLNFSSIFLRSLSPYGFAEKSGLADAYDASGFHQFYVRALDHILALNVKGVPFREEFSALLLTRMLSPFPSGYVDLQSPAGAGLGALVFNWDGDVYASDESRMLAEMGDNTFRLGSLTDSTLTFERIIGSDDLLAPLLASMTEGVPMCVDCACQPWCGADPVFHHARQGDVVGYKPTSEFCHKHMGAFHHLIEILETDDARAKVLRSWAR